MYEKVKQRRIYKTITLVTMALLAISVYFIFFFNNLQIEVYNRTNYDIDSLKIDNKFFNIKKGNSLLIDNCKSISMQAGLPFGLPQANIKGLSKDTFPIFLCGTGVKKIKNGQYQYDITISEYNNFFRLYWQKHK